jgi:hypothetical protein
MVWMTKEAAALHLGVHVATIDRKLKRGELNGKRDPRPRGWRWLVELPEDPASTETSTSPASNLKNAATDAYANAHAKELAALRELVGVLRDEVSPLQHQLEAQQKELDHRAQEMQRMQVLLQQALDPARAIAAPRQSPW